MKKLHTYGNITDGKIKAQYWDDFIKNVSYWQDCEIKITVERLYKERSTPQNKYYWGVVINEFVNGYYDTTGEQTTPEAAHEVLKSEFNYKLHVINDATLRMPLSTTELSTAEFEEYLEKCRNFILEWFGVTVPLPNENLTEIQKP